MRSYVIGVDLGQSRDPTAIAVVRAVGEPFMGEQVFQVGHLERLPLETSYPAIVGHVKGLHARLPRGAELVIDYTGVGRPVFDLFEAAEMEPIGVVITGGAAETGGGPIYSVPKLNLISGVQALLHEKRLKIHKGLPEAPVLVSELQNFRIDFTAAGHMTFNARSGAHDDLVLSVAIAVWRARQAAGSPLLSFYRAEIAAQGRQQRAEEEKGDDERLPWHRSPAVTRRNDIEDLHQVYLDTLAGIDPGASSVCATCGRPLGVTKISDGVNRWHPDCPTPGT